MQIQFTTTRGTRYILNTEINIATRTRTGAEGEQLPFISFGTQTEDGHWIAAEVVKDGKVGFVVDKGEGERGRWFSGRVAAYPITSGVPAGEESAAADETEDDDLADEE